MIEKIQKYDFSIEYKKGDQLTDADALSRLNEDEIKEKEVLGKKILEGNWAKNVVKIDGERF